MDLDNPIVQLKLTSSVCTSVAIVATVIRLFFRRFVILSDDVCALLSMLSVIAQMGIVVAIHAQTPSFIACYVIIGALFYSTVWFARLSILFSIIRIGPNLKRTQYLFAAVVLFFILLGLLIGQLFWVCEPQLTRTNSLCLQGRQIAILKLVADVIADLVLLISSLRLFLVIQDKALSFRLSCLFSTCVFTTVLSLVTSSFILKSEGIKVVIIALVEASLSLIVANFPVLFNVLSKVGENTSREAGTGRVASIVRFVDPTDI